MKIYFAHSKEIDYINELYLPVRNSEKLNKHKCILPHETNIKTNNTREFYKTIDLLIAEVSKKGTGLGIELGWAYDDSVPIYCFYKEHKNLSNSIKTITNNIYSYKDKKDLISKIEKILNNL